MATAAAKKASSAKKQNQAPDPQPTRVTTTLEQLRESGTIQAKVAWIQTHVEHVEKTGHVDFKDQRGVRTNYSHFQEHGLLQILRPLWREVGISVTEGGINVERQGNHVQITQELVVTDVNPRGNRDHGEWQMTAWYTNEGVDKQDKASNKAHTGWMKYALQKFFKVPTEGIDDNDNDDATESDSSPSATPGRETVSAEDAGVLREAIEAAVTEGHLTRARVKALLQGTYSVNTLEQLTPDDANNVASWVAQEVKRGQANG